MTTTRTSRDPFGHWPKGEAYRTPEPEPDLMALCVRCGQRHIDPTPICNRAQPEEPDID